MSEEQADAPTEKPATIAELVAAGSEWAIVEIMGHRRHAGLIREVERFGAKMIRVDLPGEGDEVSATHFYGGAAIFGIAPTDEATARRITGYDRPRPAARLTYHEPDPDPLDVEGDPDEERPF